MNLRYFALLFTLSSLYFTTAQAQLGKISARANSLNGSCFSVSTNTEKNGTQINEYSANGTVFAITWQGLRTPNFKNILGTYHSEVMSEFNSSNNLKKNKHQALVQSGNVDFHQSVHQRRKVGSAVLTANVPTCVKPGDIK